MDENASPARERLIQAAETLFSQRGYAAVRLRDIAKEVGLHHASLYHHVPGGKEELYIEVTERGLKRHQHGLETAVASAGDSIDAQLQAAALWLVSQPALNLGRMVQSDMPEISQEAAARLMMAAYQALLIPLEQIFVQAYARWGLPLDNPTLLAGAFLSMIEGVHNAPLEGTRLTKAGVAADMVRIFVYGIHPR